MRVLLWTDMEGMSRITDHRECWPAFPQYWRAGRRAFTDEVVAAASGLLDGGATEVFVVNGHGLGWPNVLWDELPDRVGQADEQAWAEGFDAMFQVGFHARAGTREGFMSHTMVPGLEVAVDGAPVTESHIWAWLMGIPVLGVAGDAALESQLDGILTGTHFLAVKRARSRGEAVAVHNDRAASLEAIRDFAKRCTRATSAPVPPDRFTLEVSMDPQLTDYAEGQHGLTRQNPAVLSVECEDWARDAQPALEAAMGAALRPLRAAEADLDLSSEKAMLEQDPVTLTGLREYFIDWARYEDAANWSS